jgi:signal transduction histidine kinase/ligand-binding sensor domain-containing protein
MNKGCNRGEFESAKKCTCKLLLLTLTIFVVAWPCQSQQYSLRQYSSSEGLPQSQVATVLEDKLGYLWVGTSGGGLGRFDGREFKVYNTFDGLVSNTVIGLLLDNKDQLWVCHPQGVSKFESNQFKKFVTHGSQTSEGKLRRIFQWQDTIYYVTAEGKWGGIYNDQLTDLKKVTNKKTLLIKPSPTKIIMVLSDSSLTVKDRSGYQNISHKKKFSKIENLFYLHGHPIIETEMGYFRLDIEKADFTRVEMPFKNYFMFFDSLQNTYWTRSKTMLFKETIGPVTNTIDTVLSESWVNQVYIDRQNNTWLATSGSGLYRYAKQDFDRCGAPSLRPVMAIMKDKKGRTWIGTLNNGLKRIYKNKVDSYQFKNSFGAGSVSTIKQNHLGEIWVGTGNGLGVYDDQSNGFKMFSNQNGLPGGSIQCFDFDENGGLWIGSMYNGIHHFQNGTTTESYSIKEKVLARSIHSIYYHHQNKTVYAGTEFGISTIKSGKVRNILFPEFSNAHILSINPYKGTTLLIGTNGSGACIYDIDKGVQKLINSRNGLPSDLVYFIVADNNGFIWVGTEKGINKLLLDAWNEIVENTYYGRDNGLTGMETNHNAYFLGKEKYFGLVDGLYEFHERNGTNQASNPLHLTDVQVYYGNYSSRVYSEKHEGFFHIPQKPTFPSDKNHITFNFNRVDKVFTNSIKYKHYLENFDKTWSLPTTQLQATYGNLPSGGYIFKVKATNNQGKWDETPLEYTFTIETPLHRTTWFKVAALAFIILMVAGLIYWRIRLRTMNAIRIEKIRFQEKELLRKDLARDFHDEMGNQLTRIINYISLLKLNINHSNGRAELYEKVEASAKVLYSGTRDFIWSIDPSNDDLIKVFIHIKDFGEELLKEKNIRFVADNTVSGSIRLPYGVSREIILIFKEALTNVFEHSCAQNVELKLDRVNGKFNIVLRDDGVGFDLAEVNEPNGLKNMRNRAERINGILRIKSAKNGSGTSVCIVLNHHKERYHDFTI